MRPTVVLATAIAALACGRPVQTAASGTPTPVPTPDPRITSADQLLQAMHGRYAGKWYLTLAFAQKSTYFRPDGSPSRVETWYEAAAIPGRLRIDLGEPSRGNGVLYRSDSVYSIQNGRVATRQKGRNVLTILAFDVYAQPPARTFAQLREERINMNVLRYDTLYGQPMFVVGAGPGDTTSNQFWVEAERLLFVRLIQSSAGSPVRDTRFQKFVAHGGGWVAEEVRFIVGGRPYLNQEYTDVRANVTFDASLFVPEKWMATPHWYKQ